jgi:2-dehydropantoate 2-reductase
VVHSVDEAADRQYSFIICAVKCLLDVKPTSAILEPLLKQLPSSPNTCIALLQNGVGIEEDLHQKLAQLGVGNPVLSGCAWVDTTAVDEGKKIVQHGNERLVLGYHVPNLSNDFSEKRAQEGLDAFCRLLQAGGVTAEHVSDIEAARWRKVLW